MDRRHPLDPFTQYRAEKRDREDQRSMEVKDAVRPYPDVRCGRCGSGDVTRNGAIAEPEADVPLVSIDWTCDDCGQMIFGEVTPNGFINLDNGRKVEE